MFMQIARRILSDRAKGQVWQGFAGDRKKHSHVSASGKAGSFAGYNPEFSQYLLCYPLQPWLTVNSSTKAGQ
jgi:hypothetical protein